MVALSEDLRRRVADRIRAIAERKGVSLRVLAQRADVSRGHLGNVLAGSAAASTDLLARLAHALEVDPEALVKRPRSAQQNKA
jgi:transcriptional regulator with XRE-family HTH domain